MMELFPGTFSQQVQSIKNSQLTKSVTTIRLRNINLISIDYGFRPRLRHRLTLSRLALDRNDHSAERFFTFLSLLMSAFSLLIPPENFTILLHRRTERSSTMHSKLCIRSFGTMLSPVKSSARADSTSELLRFL